MTVTTAVFEQQLAWLAGHGCRVVPLRTLVDALRGGEAALPPHAVAITADDGHRSVYTELFPLIRRYRIPVTLFIYPSAISNASYAMTWPEVMEMVGSGLVDVQSHSFWHPNFRDEKRRLDPDDYRSFVQMQLRRSKIVIADHVGHPVDLLAWPFGIYDLELEHAARDAGYVAAFSIERRPIAARADLMALPRYLMTDRDRGARFGAVAGC